MPQRSKPLTDPSQCVMPTRAMSREAEPSVARPGGNGAIARESKRSCAADKPQSRNDKFRFPS
jgi:hypothetical protein